MICHITISQSQRVLDAPYMFAHVLDGLSYVVVLGGTLLDNAHLFDQVSRLAASDSLTGLANHRQLLEVLENEIQRSRRTGRRFAVLLFDLDGLKKINDKYGHLTGSRAIKRLGNALRNAAGIDTPARYGGDEFALVLAGSRQAGGRAGRRRICEHIMQRRRGSVHFRQRGPGRYPADGTSIEQLLGAADRGLYQMKGAERKESV